MKISVYALDRRHSTGKPGLFGQFNIDLVIDAERIGKTGYASTETSFQLLTATPDFSQLLRIVQARKIGMGQGMPAQLPKTTSQHLGHLFVAQLKFAHQLAA